MSAGFASQGTAAPPSNTTIIQATSNLDDLVMKVRRLTNHVNMIHDQIIGPQLTPVTVARSPEATNASGNLFQVVERLRETLNELEGTIDRFQNEKG